jgi:hypothetical protein
LETKLNRVNDDSSIILDDITKPNITSNLRTNKTTKTNKSILKPSDMSKIDRT